MALSLVEQQRYLKEIGIDIWYPRLNLSNALTPLQFNEFSNQEASEGRGKSSIADISTVIAERSKQDRRDDHLAIDQSTITEPNQTVADTSEAPIRFAIRLYVVNDYLVVSSLSSNYEAQENSATRLLNSILKITLHSKIVLHHDHLISWPFFASPNASQGIVAARKYVNGVIEHLIEAYEVKTILAFGGVLAKLNNWSDLSGKLLTVPYALLPSLYKMLENPSLKKKAWQSIISSNLLSQ